MQDDRLSDPRGDISNVDDLDSTSQGQASARPTADEPDVDVFAELAARGHEAVTRVLDELASDPRLTETLDSLLAVKGRLSKATRGARSQLNVAAADSVHELRERVVELEQRLSEVEGSSHGSAAEPGDKNRSTEPSGEDSPR